MELYTFHKTIESSDFKTVTTEEYLPLDKSTIEWRWEEAEGSWDGSTHTYMGWVPYINNVKTDIFRYIQGTTKMIMSSLLADDWSYRLYYKHYEFFGLK
jgi:hypothetical protein